MGEPRRRSEAAGFRCGRCTGGRKGEEIVAVSPVARVHVPRAEAPSVQLLSRDDLKKLFKACEGKTFNDRRDMALIRLLATTGGTEDGSPRPRGRSTSTSGSVSRGFVTAKATRPESSDSTPRPREALDRYKRIRARHRLAELPALFLSRHGKLGHNSIPYVLGVRAEAAGLPRFGPHKLPALRGPTS